MKTTKKISDPLFVLWAGGGALVVYFLVYTLRKAFTASTFEGLEIWGFDYKVVVSISQVLGYLLAKFCGIKVISELKRNQRLPAIVISATCAQLSLVAFGALPQPWNAACLFVNGLSLGTMWGFLFAYIEGRRLTDILASFLGVSMIISSGAAKSFGLFVLSLGVDQFWMPALIGAVSLPLLVGFTFLLDRLPEPTEEDKRSRSERVPLDGAARRRLFMQFSAILIPLLVVNVLYTVLRDIKEDFLVNILGSTSIDMSSWLFVRVDSIVTLILLVVFGAMIMVRNNARSLHILIMFMLAGAALTLLSSVYFERLSAMPVVWLFLQSMGIYTTYLAFQTVFFERFIATFKIRGNVGFFIYIADSLGYLFSCVFLLAKEFLDSRIEWIEYYSTLSMAISLICIVAIAVASAAMRNKTDSMIISKV